MTITFATDYFICWMSVGSGCMRTVLVGGLGVVFEGVGAEEHLAAPSLLSSSTGWPSPRDARTSVVGVTSHGNGREACRARLPRGRHRLGRRAFFGLRVRQVYHARSRTPHGVSSRVVLVLCRRSSPKLTSPDTYNMPPLRTNSSSRAVSSVIIEGAG